MHTPEAITNGAGERLDTAFRPALDATRLVVIGHGVTSHHDRPYLAVLGEACARRGIAALRVSFAGNGSSEGRFEDATVSKEADDLRAVLDACDGWRVAYAGHSMGAAVGVLAASRDERIEALVSLAGMTHVARFVERHFADLVPGRDVMFERDHARLSQGFLDDARALGDTLAAARTIDVPWLLVHGEADDLVPLADSEDAAAACPRAELVTIAGADHVFTGHDHDVAERTAAWLDERWPA